MRFRSPSVLLSARSLKPYAASLPLETGSMCIAGLAQKADRKPAFVVKPGNIQAA